MEYKIIDGMTMPEVMLDTCTSPWGKYAYNSSRSSSGK